MTAARGRTALRLSSLAVLALAACTPDVAPVGTPTPTATPFAPAATATGDATPTVAPIAPASPSPAATESSPPSVRAVYAVAGDLFIQDSGGPPGRLTTGGADRRPILSPDGRQVVFFRGNPTESNRIFAVGADGTRERPVITPETLAPLGPGYGPSSEAETLAFLPGTGRLLFTTQRYDPAKATGSPPGCCGRPGARVRGDLLIADLDSAEITAILPPGTGYRPLPSPNGKLIALWAGDLLDLFDLGGRRIREGLLVFRPDWKTESYGLSWTADSAALILVAPLHGTGDPTDGPEPNGVWRYPAADEPPVEIRLNPPPLSWQYSVSPDGDWIAYDYYFFPGKTDDSIPAGIYLGDLLAGTTGLIEGGGIYGMQSNFHWSPGSVYFSFGGEGGEPLYVVDRNGRARAQDIAGGIFLAWVDDANFLYAAGDAVWMKAVAGGAERILALPEDFSALQTDDFSFTPISFAG